MSKQYYARTVEEIEQEIRGTAYRLSILKRELEDRRNKLIEQTRAAERALDRAKEIIA